VEKVPEMNKADETLDMGCLEAIETLYAWLDDELDDAQQSSRFEHHLAHCKSCYSRAELEKALTEHIRQAAGTKTDDNKLPAAPDTLQDRLEKLLQEL